ncbi:hypothetical protein IAR55_002791 [Kwoniella newhampshirensis]|uniref:Glycosyl transferase CAP10 domain-containing protein n=1 Tax=Kwoniella newhampshirensis TaxID=1651941 RepID=A0AAW0YNQ7_9TREE
MPPRTSRSPYGVSPKQKWSSRQHSISQPSSSFPLSSVGMLPHGSVPRPIRRPKKILYLLFIFFLLYWFGIRHGLGIERIPPPPLGFAVKGGRRGRKSIVSWGDTGMATLTSAQPGVKAEHPIYELMERAESQWTTMLASQSTTLLAAVAEYKRRYHMAPPTGFDVWFAFCQKHGIRIVDDYDQLMRDLLPHHALEPATFLARSKALEGTSFTYTLDIGKDQVDLTGERINSARPKHLRNLIAGFKDDLPEGFYLRVTGSDHDTGSVVLGKDQRQRAMELVKRGEQLENPNRTPAWGWFKACPLDSPANIRPGAENATEDVLRKSSKATIAADTQPNHSSSTTSPPWTSRSPSILKPVLVLSKFPGDASFQTTPMEAYMNITQDDVPFLGVWGDKTDNRLFWRGSTTGGYGGQRDWKESHRMRLHLMINGPKGGDSWWDQQLREVIIPDGESGFKVVRRWERVLSKAYADVKLSGQPVQVAKTIEFGQKVWPEQAAAFKYNLDVDGNGWSSRFHRLLSTGSPVIKFTMFPEWHMQWLTPWYHYIPLKPDYSDLYDIMAFFVGPVDEAGNVDTTKGHDRLAQKIGEAGQRFALDHWSWVDMQAYTFRLLLELQRLHSLDRDMMSYKDPEGRAA